MRQPTLLGAGPIRVTSSPAVVRHSLDAGSWVDHGPLWLTGADRLYDQLAEEMPWRTSRRWMYDRMVDDPRLTCGFDPQGPSVPAAIGPLADRLSSQYGVDFTAGFCNWYRDGHDSVAWHADRIGRQRSHPLVAIISLGGPRRFLLRPRGGGSSRRFLLHSGDLLVMGGACQHRWEHSVPKAAHGAARISVTLRQPTPEAADGITPGPGGRG